MLKPLTVQDPLSEKKVIINIQVNNDSKSRSQRTILVTTGISGQVPIMLSGHFGQLNQLIDQAWREFGQNESKPIGTNDPKSTSIAEVKAQIPDQKKTNKKSILSLF